MNSHEPIVADASKTIQQALATVARTLRVLGEAYFPMLVENLAKTLDVRCVMVCRFDPDRPKEASTLAFWDNGLGENFVYELAHTPCADVSSDQVCCFADGIQAKYPQDQMLVDMGARSYAGTPLRASDGRVLGLIAILDEKPFPDPEAITQIVELFSGRAAAELERLTTASLNERLGKIVEASVSEAYVFDGKTFRFELVNRGGRENLGYTMEELRELSPWDIKPEYTREQFIEYVQPLINGEVNVLMFETVHQRKDSTEYPVAVNLQYFPDAGPVFFASITDITERREREEREKLLLREVNHRAKNVLAVVQVLARQTAKRDPEDYLEKLEARIAALAASHDVLVDNAWQDVPFEELVRTQLGHFRPLIGNRITLDGPPLRIKASAAQTFGMALHELSTNAAKYGALSNEGGTVAIAWRETSEGDAGTVLELTWQESGGPKVETPDRSGFGSVLIERSLAGQFGSSIDIDYAPDGVRYRFRTPSSAIMADCSAA